jgi:predicted ATPase
MTLRLAKLHAVNYRSLANVELELGPINVFFGPNGAGKSTILDTIWFVRDCAIRGVETASSDRDHGIGLLYDSAEPGARLAVSLATDEIRYTLDFSFSNGRIDPFVGERLESKAVDELLIRRDPRARRVDFYNFERSQVESGGLREPEKISLNRYLDYTQCEAASGLDQILHYVRNYHSRTFHLYALKNMARRVATSQQSTRERTTSGPSSEISNQPGGSMLGMRR